MTNEFISTPYPLLNSTHTQSPQTLVQYAGTVVDSVVGFEGTAGFLFLTMMMFIAFLTLNTLTFDKRLLATLFVGTVFSALFAIIGWLGTMYMAIFGALTFIVWVLVK